MKMLLILKKNLRQMYAKCKASRPKQLEFFFNENKLNKKLKTKTEDRRPKTEN